MDLNFDSTNALIRLRRSYYPNEFISNEEIDASVLNELLKNALSAPNHKLTKPWKFLIFSGLEAKKKLREEMLRTFEIQNKNVTEIAQNKIETNINKSSAVLLLSLKYSDLVPQWEEDASLGCAVENLWISLRSYGLGGYWSSPSYFINQTRLVSDSYTCKGLFYIGKIDLEAQKPAKDFDDFSTFVSWI